MTKSADYPEPWIMPMSSDWNGTAWSWLDESDCRGAGLEPAHPAVKVFLAICFSLTIVFCGVGNCILTFIIFTQKRLRSVTNLLIANLAVSDALLAMLCAPFELHFYLHNNWVFGKVMCPLMGSVKFISLFVSVNTLLVIAVDRWVFLNSEKCAKAVWLKTARHSTHINKHKSSNVLIFTFTLWHLPYFHLC